MKRDMTMKDMERMEKEQERLRELHAMKAEGVGMVSLLDHEILAKSKIQYVNRLRAAKDALRAIQANPADAQRLAAAALAADEESM